MHDQNSRIHELVIYLRTIRQPYLSDAPAPRRRHFGAGNDPRSASVKDQIYFSNAQRDQIDAEAKGVLRDLHAAVYTLKQAEQIRQNADAALVKKRRHRNGFGVLGTWANGGSRAELGPEERAEDERATTIAAHREGVVWFLESRLQDCGGLQTIMMQTRINRELERNKSVLYKAEGVGLLWKDVSESSASRRATKASPNKMKAEELDAPQEDAQSSSGPVQGFTEELLVEENKNMMKLYEDKLSKVRSVLPSGLCCHPQAYQTIAAANDMSRNVEKSLVEISEMQSSIVQNLNLQSEQLDQLVQDSQSTEENVDSGNKELKRASERRSMAKLVFYSSVGLCSAAILWDFYV